jgi:hypothetical protein
VSYDHLSRERVISTSLDLFSAALSGALMLMIQSYISSLSDIDGFAMSVECPSTLGFHRPLTQLVKETILVRNPNNRPVAFKVKTTAPKQYCVRPNSGRIEPGQEVEVQGMDLHAVSYSMANMVQSCCRQ